VLAYRANGADGNTQPLVQPWNLQGMDNPVQEVPVTVR